MRTLYQTLMILLASILLSTGIVANDETQKTNSLENIIIPIVDFEDVSADQALDILRQRARELHLKDKDPTRKGVSFVVISEVNPISDKADISEFGAKSLDQSTLVTFKAQNIGLFEIITEVCRQAKLEAYLTKNTILIVPEGVRPDPDHQIIRIIRKRPTKTP